MSIENVVAEIEAEIAKLEQAKSLLLPFADATVPGRRGRPPGSKNTIAKASVKSGGISAAGRKAISLAMKRRWAERRKAQAAGKSA